MLHFVVYVTVFGALCSGAAIRKPGGTVIRKPGTELKSLEVTLSIYSGVENPSWVVQQNDEYFWKIYSLLQYHESTPLPSVLGYRGLTVQGGSSLLSRSIAAGSNYELEVSLLYSGVNSGDTEIIETVSRLLCEQTADTQFCDLVAADELIDPRLPESTIASDSTWSPLSTTSQSTTTDNQPPYSSTSERSPVTLSSKSATPTHSISSSTPTSSSLPTPPSPSSSTLSSSSSRTTSASTQPPSPSSSTSSSSRTTTASTQPPSPSSSTTSSSSSRTTSASTKSTAPSPPSPTTLASSPRTTLTSSPSSTVSSSMPPETSPPTTPGHSTTRPPKPTTKKPCVCPKYEPGSWNNDKTVKENNNCYNYATNKKTGTFAQPGRGSGKIYTSLTGAAVRDAAVRDGLKVLRNPGAGKFPKTDDCLVALVIWPGNDFHWYRRDKNGNWSHKAGSTAATNRDNSGNVITDPRTADLGPYKFVTFMSVCPKDVTIKK